jgi:hypothetical protein
MSTAIVIAAGFINLIVVLQAVFRPSSGQRDYRLLFKKRSMPSAAEIAFEFTS